MPGVNRLAYPAPVVARNEDGVAVTIEARDDTDVPAATAVHHGDSADRSSDTGTVEPAQCQVVDALRAGDVTQESTAPQARAVQADLAGALAYETARALHEIGRMVVLASWCEGQRDRCLAAPARSPITDDDFHASF